LAPVNEKEEAARTAQKTLRHAVAEKPQFARGHYLLGVICRQLGQADHAERAFRDALEGDETIIEAQRELRLLTMRRGKPGSGRSGFDSSTGSGIFKLFKKK